MEFAFYGGDRKCFSCILLGKKKKKIHIGLNKEIYTMVSDNGTNCTRLLNSKNLTQDEVLL